MKKTEKLLRSFVVEIVVYAALMAGYVLLVLHFLGGRLKLLFDADKPLYAVTALLLIIGQGWLLQLFTTWLLGLVRAKTE